MNIPEGINELFREKSLLAVYRKSIFLSENKFDIVFKFSFLFLFIVFCLYVNIFHRSYLYVLFDALNKWSDIGFNYSVQILGFLLAGFTIFATTTDIKVFIGLSQVVHKGRKINELRFLFMSFLKVFIVHLTVLISCVFVGMIKLFIKPTLHLLISDNSVAYAVRSTLVTIVCVVIGYFIISALFQLKTFVWNLYQSVIFSVASSAALNSSPKNPTQD